MNEDAIYFFFNYFDEINIIASSRELEICASLVSVQPSVNVVQIDLITTKLQTIQ